MQSIEIWQLAGSVSKLLSLLAIAGVVGGVFSIALVQLLDFPKQAKLLSYMLASAVLGLLASLLFFLVQVGAINQNGVAGMLDPTMASIMAQSSLGHVTGLRLLSFASVFLVWFLYLRDQHLASQRQYYTKTAYLLLVAVIGLLVISFALSGHLSSLSMLAQTAIVFHVLTVFLWVGSLYPLLQLSTVTDLPKVQKLLRCFGNAALFIVALLLTSGIYMLTQLLPSFSAVVGTPYGLTMLLKLTGVSCLLALGALNKLLLVPRLTSHNSTRLVQTSIRMEIILALLILLVTTWLTTALSPPLASFR